MAAARDDHTARERIHILRESIIEIATRHGAYNVRLFGSVASGAARPDSDIDLLVDVGPVHSSWFPAGLVSDLEDLLHCEVDVVTEDALHWSVRARVLAEAVAL